METFYLSPVLETFFAFLMAMLGGSVVLFSSVSHRQLCALISFAGGTLLGVALFHVVPHALEALAPLPILGAILSGFVLFFALSRLVHICPACAASHLEAHTTAELKNIGSWLGVAFVLHNLMDGLAMEAGGQIEHAFGPSLFLGVLIHKLPEGIALSALFLKGGFSKKKAFFLTALFESVTILGGLLGGIFFGQTPNLFWVNMLLLHAAGGFTYLALHAVWAEAREHSPGVVLVCFSVGLGLMGLLRSFLQ